MQRYFTEKLDNNTFILNKDDTYHIKKVMRMNLGDKIEVIYNKELYIAEITNYDDLTKAKIIDKLDEYNELSNQIILVQSLVKEQKMDYILQKNTELGVSTFIPYQADRSIVKIKDNDTKKIDRWSKIVKEASEQSKRNIIPDVTNVMNINDLIKIKADIKILCSVNEKSVSIKNVIENVDKNSKILVVIGPEGGFSDNEEAKLMENGFVCVSLGSSVLRTETASVFVLSCIRYINMG